VPTYSPKPGEVTRNWLVIDAENVVLGHLAVAVANLLRGKHKPQFARHIDTGDFVVVINADKIALTGKKAQDEKSIRHSGYPGGLKAIPMGELLARNPRKAVERAVWGMMPKNKLSAKLITKLKVYAGSEHPHEAQKPQPFQINHAQ
jgi:large subunit ribosomal protein L13